MNKGTLIRSVCSVVLCCVFSVLLGVGCVVTGGIKGNTDGEESPQKEILEERQKGVYVNNTPVDDINETNSTDLSETNGSNINGTNNSKADHNDTELSSDAEPGRIEEKKTSPLLFDEYAINHLALVDAEVEKHTRSLQENPLDAEGMLLLNNAKQNASLAHMQRAEALTSKKFFREALTELQISIAFYPGNSRAVELIDKLKRMRESLFYTEKGERLVKSGSFNKARDAFLNALELDPDNKRAGEALEQYRKSEDEMPEYSLDLRSHAPVSFKFKKTPVINVFEIISKLTGVNFIFDKDVKESKVTLFMTDVKFDQFLSVLLSTNNLASKLINSKTILIYPDTPMKGKIYDELMVETFYLSHLKAKNAVAILSKIVKTKNVIANNELNSITIRGKRDEVEMASRIIEANDRVHSEVVLNVEILEVSRTREKNLGLSISDSITLGVSRTSSGIENSADSVMGFAPMASLNDISDITSKELYLSLPTATLMLLKQDGDTKILAKPQIRVSNYSKATILIGERIPLRSNRKVQTDGSITYDYQYQDVGIKLVTEPVITRYDQINLKLNLEISSLGNNVGTKDDLQYAIKTKSTTTVLTIHDGDTVILGGLIQDENRETIKKIPLLGDIPILGRLFTSVNKENVETDIIMTITPVIIRSQDIPRRDLLSFWSGNEKNISLKKPFEGRNEVGMQFNDYPAEEYIMAMEEDVFLPGEHSLTIQVNSYKEQDKARQRADELETLGYKTWVMEADIPGKGIFHRVFVGQFNSYNIADAACREMLEKEYFAHDIRVVDKSYVFGR